MPVPDYKGTSIANLMTSLVSGLGGGEMTCDPSGLLPPEEIGGYRNVVLLVLDGLGHDYLRGHPEAAWLNGHLRGRITSVFPSTTATAITTFLTGEPPSRHGLTGWHMYLRELGSVLAVLPGRARYGGAGLAEAGVSAAALFAPAPVFDRLAVESFVVAPAHIAGSDFNQAYTGRASSRPYRGLRPMVDILGELARDSTGRRFIYAYWPEFDAIGHSAGTCSDMAVAHLKELDTVLASLADWLAGTDTLLVVTADHGQIDTCDADRIFLDDHPALGRMLVLPLCGESRAAYCYVRSGCATEFERYVADNLSHAADLHRSEDLVAQGWYGPGVPHERLADRVGDYALVMKKHYVIKDWLPQENRYTLIGVHGGTSAAEMYVPLVVWSG